VRQLSEEIPVARLNARQSAVGTLLVAGAKAAVWEGTSSVTGAANIRGELAGSQIKTAGNRPLVGFHNGWAVITLRHLRQLRRALFIGGDTAMAVTGLTGSGIAIDPRSSAGLRGVLYLHRIDDVLELRAEYSTNVHDADIWAEFGFRMTLPVF
jgi:hypothetical protein